MLASSSTDVIGIVVAALLFMLSVIGTLVGIIFNDLRKQLRDNTKHIEGVMGTIGPLMWRTIGVEEFLERNFDYPVPRDIGWSEHNR